MMKACLAVRQGISFTVWGFTDPTRGFLSFSPRGYATIYDVNQQPKPGLPRIASDLQLAAHGAPHRVSTPMPGRRVPNPGGTLSIAGCPSRAAAIRRLRTRYLARTGRAKDRAAPTATAREDNSPR